MTPNDTICAVSTPPGVGGIAVVRISGPDTFPIVSRIWRGHEIVSMASHTAHLGEITDRDGATLDQCLLTIFRAPHSFTSEDVAEISVHGSRYIQRELIAALIGAGARLAEPGEFTRRAFASGRLDLAEAEAVADVIASESRAAHRIAINQMKGRFSRRLAQLRQNLVELVALMELELDFSEEDVEFASRAKLLDIAIQISNEINRLHNSFATGDAIKNGIPVAIIGAPNAGKSSLLNLILGDDRAIVSEIRGTTRDTIEETVTIGDYLFRFIDTAGIRHNTTDQIERLGIDRSLAAIQKARIILLVTDPTAVFGFGSDSTVPTGCDSNLTTSTCSDFNSDSVLFTSSDSNLLPEGVTIPDGATLIILANKIDLLPAPHEVTGPENIDTLQNSIETPTLSASGPNNTDEAPSIKRQIIPISAKTGEGLEQLKTALVAAIARDTAGDDILVVNARHAEALASAGQSILRTIDGLRAGLPGDLISQDIRETLHHLAAITGDIPSTEILATIFSRFCIGK